MIVQSDIRDGVSVEDGQNVGKDIDACLLHETSAKTKENCDKLKADLLSLLITKNQGGKRPQWVSVTEFHDSFSLT